MWPEPPGLAVRLEGAERFVASTCYGQAVSGSHPAQPVQPDQPDQPAQTIPSVPAIATPAALSPPWEGPLLALHRLMQHHPEQLLLLCPVDMPDLTLAALQALLAAAAASPGRLPLAHDGTRLQPLLGLYPSSAPIRAHLAAAVQRGERRLQGWLSDLPCQVVPLDPRAIRNQNRPSS